MPPGEGDGTPLQYSCLENPMDGGARWAAVHGVTKSRTWLSDFTFIFHFHALEKEMATHSSDLAWRIPGMAEPGGLLSMGSHRVRHDWSDLAAVAAAVTAGKWWFDVQIPYLLVRGLFVCFVLIFLFSSFWLHDMTCGISVPWLGTWAMAVTWPYSNHLATRELPGRKFLETDTKTGLNVLRFSYRKQLWKKIGRLKRLSVPSFRLYQSDPRGGKREGQLRAKVPQGAQQSKDSWARLRGVREPELTTRGIPCLSAINRP